MEKPILTSALATIDVEARGLQQLRDALHGDLGSALEQAVGRILSARGRVIITGMGKSGHICRKIAATLASTGTPAYFVHPAEAGHGDLGMITGDDVVLAASWSGESPELAAILAYAGRFKVPLIAMTSKAGSTLGRAADVVLELPKVEEACPHGLAPTTSALLQLALGDALAIALLEGRGFTAQDFRVFHPGGKLGASLRSVREVMHVGDAMPLVASGTTMRDALVVMTGKSFGCLGVLGETGVLVGIITDGDLRRHLSDHLLSVTVDEIMTARPKTVRPDTLLARAIEMLSSSSITSLFVLDEGRPVGIVHMHDLLRIGVA
jgi:arabinose-5-phosphate isomerase